MALNSYTSSGGASGTGTAGATLAAVGSGEVNGQVMIQVLSTEAAGVEVVFNDSTNGIHVEAGKEQSFLCDDLGKIKVKRVGGADIAFRYWAF